MSAAAPPRAPASTVRRAMHADLPDLLQFYRRHHPQRTRLCNAEVQSWLFARQPGSDSTLPLFILESGGEVVGSIGYVGARLCRDGETSELAFPINYFVSDEFKGLPALRLFKAVMAEKHSLAGAYVSGDARRLLGKLRFADRSSDLKGYHYGLLVPTTWREFLTSGIRRTAESLRTFWRAASLRRAGHHVSRNLDDAFIAGMHGIPGTIHVEKSAGFVRWRYADSPAMDCHFIYQTIGRTPAGLLVTHYDASRRELVILDILCKEGRLWQLTGLVDASITLARELGCSALVTHALSARMDKVLRRCLFGSAASDLGMFLFSAIGPIHQALAADPDLHLMLGDTDAY